DLPLIERVAQRAWRHRNRAGEAIQVDIVTQDLQQGAARARLVMVTDLSRRRQQERVRQQLSRRVTDVIENMTDAFFALDRNWCFTYVNAHAEKVLQRSREELLGCNVWEKYPAAVGSIYQIEYERALAESRTTRFEAPDADGLNTWLSVTAYPSREGLAVYFRDISEKHRVERALREERQVLASVINATDDAIVATDVKGRIRMFNPGAERVFGYSSEAVLGQSMELLLPEAARSAHPLHLREFAASETASRSLGSGRRVQGVRSDRQPIELEATISKVSQGDELLLIACLRDVTERIHRDAELQRSRAQLSDLTQRLMAQERTLVRGLAQTLHDHLGQTMAAIRMAHETVLTFQSDQGVAPAPEIVRLQAQMGVLMGHAVSQIRQVLMDLRPPLLEERGLLAALDNEVRSRALTHPRVDLSLRVAAASSELRWPPELEYAAFMVAREAIENALRHSGSPSVLVRIAGSTHALQLEVVDLGHGVMAEPDGRTRHLGILGMRERAQTIGAQVRIDSTPGRGTCVSFSWSATP
ncbi:MAG: PAS domain S-box protein, partial [Comamonadaceae bacterium]